VDLVAYVPGALSVEETTRLETDIVDALKAVRKEIAEVSVKFRSLEISPRSQDYREEAQ